MAEKTLETSCPVCGAADRSAEFADVVAGFDENTRLWRAAARAAAKVTYAGGVGFVLRFRGVHEWTEAERELGAGYLRRIADELLADMPAMNDNPSFVCEPRRRRESDRELASVSG